MAWFDPPERPYSVLFEDDKGQHWRQRQPVMARNQDEANQKATELAAKRGWSLVDAERDD